MRQGRQINLPWLVALIRVGLPQYVIPAEWLPVVVLPTASTQLLLV